MPQCGAAQMQPNLSHSGKTEKNIWYSLNPLWVLKRGKSGTGTGLSAPFFKYSCFDFNFLFFILRRRNDENVTLETICHDPQKPLYGHMLDDSSSEQCLMKEKKDNGGLMFMCSCTDEECNDVLIFSTGRFNNLPCIAGLYLTRNIKSLMPMDLQFIEENLQLLETFWSLLKRGAQDFLAVCRSWGKYWYWFDHRW